MLNVRTYGSKSMVFCGEFVHNSNLKNLLQHSNSTEQTKRIHLQGIDQICAK